MILLTRKDFPHDSYFADIIDRKISYLVDNYLTVLLWEPLFDFTYYDTVESVLRDMRDE